MFCPLEPFLPLARASRTAAFMTWGVGERARHGDVHDTRRAHELHRPEQDPVQFRDQEYFRMRGGAGAVARTPRYSGFIFVFTVWGILCNNQASDGKVPHVGLDICNLNLISDLRICAIRLSHSGLLFLLQCTFTHMAHLLHAAHLSLDTIVVPMSNEQNSY